MTNLIVLLVFKVVYLGINRIYLIISNAPYEEDDKEADDVYQSVADHMSERRKDRKEDLEKQRVELLDREHMDVKRQFEDLKVLFHVIILL